MKEIDLSTVLSVVAIVMVLVFVSPTCSFIPDHERRIEEMEREIERLKARDTSIERYLRGQEDLVEKLEDSE